MRLKERRSGIAPCRALAAISGLLAVAAAPPASPPPSATPQPDIVVRAPEEQNAHGFVDAMTDRNQSHQIARWNREVCPTIEGIAPAQVAAMETRIGEIAKTLDLAFRTQQCTTTMHVFVDNDPDGVATALAKRYPNMLRIDGSGKLTHFVASKQPIRWLSVTNVCGFKSCAVTGSRLRAAESPALTVMVVIVDGRQIGQLSLSEIADYVTFVALANPEIGKTWPSSSIMSMFDTAHPEGSRFHLTDEDTAYLRGLYASPPDGLGQTQRQSIVSTMKRQGHVAD